jgi:hypothetical protein
MGGTSWSGLSTIYGLSFFTPFNQVSLILGGTKSAMLSKAAFVATFKSGSN